jgi:lysophospholipid acyltransferase (LPLAT)-like uncharacterized protein
MSARPIVPLSFAASRAWYLQWDRFVLPFPFARIAIVIGEPLQVPKGLDAAALERFQQELEGRLNDLASRAKVNLA